MIGSMGSSASAAMRPVALQSMTSTYTYDIDATVKQINALQAAGADLVRVAVPDKQDTEALKEILNQVQHSADRGRAFPFRAGAGSDRSRHPQDPPESRQHQGPAQGGKGDRRLPRAQASPSASAPTRAASSNAATRPSGPRRRRPSKKTTRAR